MSSRLDRLFVLLESGTSSVTRKAAATQLGEVVRVHPIELHSLLNRIHTLLHSTSWDTRIAAANAVEAVVNNLPDSNPAAGSMDRNLGLNDHHQRGEQEDGECDSEYSMLNFEEFHIDQILSNTIYLMANKMDEYNIVESMVPNDVNNELIIMKHVTDQINNISSAFGVGSSFGGSEGILNFSDIISPEDVKVSLEDSLKSKCTTKKSVKEILNLDLKNQKFFNTNSDGSKRMRKLLNSEDDDPLELFTVKLKDDLFSPKWEIRHGAATALREILKSQGKKSQFEENCRQQRQQLWLEDLSIRLICVLALDRFGDYVSDQVVAPVRETSAQCIGSVLNLMSNDRVNLVAKFLTRLLNADDWDARHGGLLGLKYLLAVRQDMIDCLLPDVFSEILSKFADPIDDVRAAAANSLIPICQKIVSSLPESVPGLIQKLFNLLLEVEEDDIGSSSNHFMDLLGSLFDQPSTKCLLNSDDNNNMMLKMMPRLWPFLSHNSASVRKASLQTLSTLISLSKEAVRQHNTIVVQTLRNIFSRAVLESNPSILELIEQVWYNVVTNGDHEQLSTMAATYFQLWLYVVMQPANVSFDSSILFHGGEEQNSTNECFDGNLFIGGDDTVPPEIRNENVTRVRCVTARMLGVLAFNVMKIKVDGVKDVLISSKSSTNDSADNNIEVSAINPVNCSTNHIKDTILFHLNTRSAVQRTVSALVITELSKLWKINDFPLNDLQPLQTRLNECLSEIVYFDEIGGHYTTLLQDTKDYLATLNSHKIPLQTPITSPILSLDDILEITDKQKEELFSDKIANTTLVEKLKENRLYLRNLALKIQSEQSTLTTSTMAVISGAVMTLENIPTKISLIIKPLMDSIQKEESGILQEASANHLAKMVDFCVTRNPPPGPNSKIITNLCSYLNCDIESTILNPPGIEGNNFGIVTLFQQQQKAAPERTTGAAARLKRMSSTSSITSRENATSADISDQQSSNIIQKRGATLALTKIVKIEAQNLSKKVPDLWNIIYTDIMRKLNPLELLQNDEGGAKKLIENLQVLEIVIPYIDEMILPDILSVLKELYHLLIHPYFGVRHLASRCIGVFAKLDLTGCMSMIINQVLPLLESSDIFGRQGAIESISIISERLELNILPYIVVLIVPLLGRMSDQDESVRLLATHCFGHLVQLIPLDGILPNLPDVPSDLLSVIEEQRTFLSRLLNPKLIENYTIPIPIKTELRSYQQCGVNWLGFLNKYKLHGILCDDMGLGKTLQSLCILTASHSEIEKRKNLEKNNCNSSLVICPPTLISHWADEINKFIPSNCLKPLQYEGMPSERERLRNFIVGGIKFNVIIASYDIVRKDLEFFSNFQWNYCILDEGHIIKNGKTKIAKAIKKLPARHRLILSGTPIQNNVLELWSLFDFLMPGFLGTEKEFNSKYSKPIFISRDLKCSAKEQEAGILAMESLHHQVLPFILRRMKEDVLKDLPPKITQDYYCDLSPVQRLLYEDFSKTETVQMSNKFSVFQALRYLQSVCNHPKLVLNPNHPQFEKIQKLLQNDGSDLNNIQNSAKLPALKQLLIDCGIGSGESDTFDSSVSIDTSSIVSQHRVLIFCQLKSMLNIIESDLLKQHMPSVTYLRIDGDVPASDRQNLVNRFNNDPSIDVLLLTTRVGGLGLNLTGADTVIFVEHDWSPMKDLQAMDRAHRIGQKKVVNVYRLITRNTLEEKIMGFQKFKLFTAKSVINDQNSTLSSMSTDKMLDLFTLNKNHNPRSDIDQQSSNSASSSNNNKNNIIKDIFKTLPELWDNKDYEEEYDLSSFIETLKT